MLKTLIFTIFALFFAVSIDAATYYVDQTHGSASDSNNGAESTPWATIGKCTTTLVAGDTCQVKAATYTEDVAEATSGTSGNEIVYQANGAGVIISGDVTLTGDYIHVKDFEVTNGGFTLTRASYCLIENNYIHDTGNAVPILLVASTMYNDDDSCQYNVIKDNEITRGEDVGISLSGQNHLAIGNEIYALSGGNRDGIHFHGAYHMIKNNYIHDNVHPAESDPHIDCFQAWRTAHDTIFDGNICVNTNTTKSNQIVMLEEFSDQDGDVHDLTWRNNIFDFSDPGYCPLRINQKNAGREIENINMYNNTFIHRNPLGKGEAALNFVRINGVNVQNNIVYNFGDGSAYKDWFKCTTCQNVTTSNNLVYVTDGDPPNDATNTNGVYTDPKFVNLAGQDYQLQSDSPARSAGFSIASVVDDILGVSRPQGLAYDMGAYEFSTPATTDGTLLYRPYLKSRVGSGIYVY